MVISPAYFACFHDAFHLLEIVFGAALMPNGKACCNFFHFKSKLIEANNPNNPNNHNNPNNPHNPNN